VIEPGHVHRKIAAVALRKLQEKTDGKIAVGDLPVPVSEGGDGSAEDGREPVELLARILAHVGHRIPGLRKVEGALEGADKKSGMLSDLAAFAGQLVSRNEDLFIALGEQVLGDVMANKKPKAAAPKVEPIVGHFDDPTPTEQ
jgi:hypothetical protein